MAQTSYQAENPFDDEPQNPFEEDEQPKVKSSYSFKQESTFVPNIPKSNIIQTPVTNNSTPFINFELTPEALARKEAELNLREEQLQKREQGLIAKEESLPQPRVNNWPRCRPFLYHDIRADMPTPESVSLVRKAYIAWFVTIAALVYNCATILAALIVEQTGNSTLASFFLSLFYIVFCVPVTFLVYRLLYNAARRSKPSLYILFFIFLWLEILAFAGIFALGLNGWGGGGFFLMLNSWGSSIAVGVISLICFIIWIGIILWSLVLFFLCRREYKKLGGLAKAKMEFGDAAAQGIANNPELVAQGLKSTY